MSPTAATEPATEPAAAAAPPSPPRIAIVGGGVSGLGAAEAYGKLGFACTVFEQSGRVGGQWGSTFGGARIQQMADTYRSPRLGWAAAGVRPAPERYSTREDVLRYSAAWARHFKLDVRLRTRVVRASEVLGGAESESDDDGGGVVGWKLVTRTVKAGASAGGGAGADEAGGAGVEVEEEEGEEEEHPVFDYLVVATGLFGEKDVPKWPGLETFKGLVVTGRDVDPATAFAGKEHVVVIGNGKTALDMAVAAAEADGGGGGGGGGSKDKTPTTTSPPRVTQLIRTPHYFVPKYLPGGVEAVRVFLSRQGGSFFMPCWSHPSPGERFLHKWLGFVVAGIWGVISFMMRASLRSSVKSWPASPPARAAAEQRLSKVLDVPHSVRRDLRGALGMAPDMYPQYIVDAKIDPVLGEVASVTPDGVTLRSGESVACDALAVCVGSGKFIPPAFLPEKHQAALEAQPGLYRHAIHPRIPRCAFAGFNHSIMHMASVEVASVWTAAVWRKQLTLPPADEQEACMRRVLAWKRANQSPDQCAAWVTATCFQQYLDTILIDLGLNPARKSNPIAENFGCYAPADYANVVNEWLAASAKRTKPLHVHTEIDM